MHDTARLAQKSFTATHEELPLVISVLYQRPPPTPPANTFLLVLSVGSNIIALTRPPTSLGPLSVHLLAALPPGATVCTPLDPLFICFKTGTNLSQ